jgi:hypothetical protein
MLVKMNNLKILSMLWNDSLFDGGKEIVIGDQMWHG